MDRKQLIKAAMDARKNSYTPYSHYNVGAALLCEDGEIICGSNIENASYPATVCAERCAIFTAVASGHRDFTAIVVCGGADTESGVLSGYAYPCGICRQVMREFTDPDKFTIIVARSVDDYKEFTLSELLPNSFGPENL
jgi:cytidine deaminase